MAAPFNIQTASEFWLSYARYHKAIGNTFFDTLDCPFWQLS